MTSFEKMAEMKCIVFLKNLLGYFFSHHSVNPLVSCCQSKFDTFSFANLKKKSSLKIPFLNKKHFSISSLGVFDFGPLLKVHFDELLNNIMQDLYLLHKSIIDTQVN